MHLEGELRRAIEHGQLSVAYQPLFSLGSGRLTGFEALARWQHPTLGLISPATFIPIAEESALIAPLTDFVLDAACRQLRSGRRAARPSPTSACRSTCRATTSRPQRLRVARHALIVAARLHPSQLTLELTENVLMDRVDGAVETLARLRELGVSLSIDDFGTGYSSLAYPPRCPSTA